MHTTKLPLYFVLQLPLQRHDYSICSQSKEPLPFWCKHSLTLYRDVKNYFPVINKDKTVNSIVKEALGGGLKLKGANQRTQRSDVQPYHRPWRRKSVQAALHCASDISSIFANNVMAFLQVWGFGCFCCCSIALFLIHWFRKESWGTNSNKTWAKRCLRCSFSSH